MILTSGCDTSAPILCEKCGEEHFTTQTKHFENILTHYYVGDIVSGQLITGILEEFIFCEHKSSESDLNTSFEQKIYLIIWQRILIDVVSNYEEGENKLRAFGIGDLYLLHQDMFQRKNDFEAKYTRIKSYIKTFSESFTLNSEEIQKFKQKANIFSTFPSMDLMGVIDKEKPLEELVNELEKMDFRQKTLF